METRIFNPNFEAKLLQVAPHCEESVTIV